MTERLTAQEYMDVLAAKEVERKTRDDYRLALRILLEDAEIILQRATKNGRRLDALRCAVDDIHGALRNVCDEDGVKLKDGDEFCKQCQAWIAKGRDHWCLDSGR